METELTVKECFKILTNCVVAGQARGAFAIKESAKLYKIIKEEDLESKENFENLVRAVAHANSKGAYSLEDASIIESIIDYLVSKELVKIE